MIAAACFETHGLRRALQHAGLKLSPNVIASQQVGAKRRPLAAKQSSLVATLIGSQGLLAMTNIGAGPQDEPR
jgi:hypothetical protein